MSERPTADNRGRSLKSWLKIRIAPALAAALIKLMHSLVRWERNDILSMNVAEPMIGAFWHGRQLMLAPLFSQRGDFPVSMLISSHADGQLIAKAVEWFGISTIYGSSSRNGSQALLQMVDALKLGSSVAITPDGPRGPERKAKAGIVKLASVSGCKIIPVSFNSSSYWQFKSWDKMRLPKPFSKGVCLCGEPIVIPKDIEGEVFDHWVNTVEQALTAITEKTDSFIFSK